MNLSALNAGAMPLGLLKEATFWFSKGEGSIAQSSDQAFYVIFWICFFFFWLIIGVMAVIMVRYRMREDYKPKPGPTHHDALEITWTIIPLLLVVVIFWVNFKGFVNLNTPPEDSYPVNVTAQKWSWSFEYPNGLIIDELHVPAGENVTLTMSSMDVIHSLFIPDFRVKKDVVPGRYSHLWFNTDEMEEGEEASVHHLFCTEYCGTEHSTMISSVYVHEPSDFEAWLADASYLGDEAIADAGKTFYNRLGCQQCHSVDGTASTGPTFQNLYGNERTMASGETLTADDNYIRESILEPMAKIRSGYQGVMPSFKGRIKDEEVRWLIAYLKTLSDTVPEETKELLRGTPAKMFDEEGNIMDGAPAEGGNEAAEGEGGADDETETDTEGETGEGELMGNATGGAKE